MSRSRRASAAACSSQPRRVPVKPWSSSSGRPARVADRPAARRRRRRCRSRQDRQRPRRRPRASRGARRSELGRCAARGPGRPAGRSSRRWPPPGRPCADATVLAAERRRRSARHRRRGASRTAARSARAARARATSGCAWGRNEKMPPPSLSTSTIVADRSWRRAATSALRSCRNDTSPTTSATGPAAAAADPSAVDTTPSMPFAPRFETDRIAAAVDGSQPSRSRTGIELPAHSTAPSGQRVRERRRTARPRTARRARSSQPPSRGASAARSASSQSRSRLPSAGAAVPRRIGERVRGRARRRHGRTSPAAAPARSSRRRLDDDLRRPRVRSAARASAWTSASPRPDDEVRACASVQRPGPHELVRRARRRSDRSCGPRAEAGQRIGEDRVAGRPRRVAAMASGSTGRRRGPATMRPRAAGRGAPRARRARPRRGPAARRRRS